MKNKWEELFESDEDLVHFMRNMQKFDRLFCDALARGDEFTLRFEVKGDKGILVHCRVGTDEWDKVDKPKEKKGKIKKAV